MGSGCNGVVAATTCTEQSVPAGTWVYTETPVQLNWTGGASPDSAHGHRVLTRSSNRPRLGR